MSKSGLFSSVSRLFSNSIDLLLNRLNILSVDFEISIQRLIAILSLFLFGIFFLCMAIFLLVILLVVIFWDTHRVLVISGLLGAFIVIGLGLFLIARQKLKGMPHFFEATVAELKTDQQRFRRRDE
jgi:uncharacterized membrane protein YqjE